MQRGPGSHDQSGTPGIFIKRGKLFGHSKCGGAQPCVGLHVLRLSTAILVCHITMSALVCEKRPFLVSFECGVLYARPCYYLSNKEEGGKIDSEGFRWPVAQHRALGSA
jgi:hypothetical protein